MNKVKIKIHGFPEISEKIGSSAFEMMVEGNTFGDLLDSISQKYGEDVKQALLIQVMKNGKEWIDKKDMSIPVNDGDSFSFFTMIAGG
jgi:molybdopterin converting factor small subunit